MTLLSVQKKEIQIQLLTRGMFLYTENLDLLLQSNPTILILLHFSEQKNNWLFAGISISNFSY